MATVLTEGVHDFGFILSEASGQRSRENAYVKDGEGKLTAGTVLGVVTSGGTNEVGRYRSCDPTNNDGSQTAVAILCQNVDASTDDAACVVIARDAEVNLNGLQWDANADLQSERNTMLVALATKHIIARD